jgi:hypothetical protein
MPPGLSHSLLGALSLAALSTFFDFIWARYLPGHRTVFGLIHGALLFLALGGYLGAVRGRPARGALGGAVVGLAAAVGFYALAPLFGMSAMFPSWMALWLGFAFLDARWLCPGPRGSGAALARGALAALASGLAFYAISGIWTRPSPGGPDYPRHFASWTVAFLPGLLALLLSRPASPGRSPAS